MSTPETNPDPRLPIIGWREWVALPELGIHKIKAKVDSGARSSSLYASAIEEFDKAGEKFIRFQVPTIQGNDDKLQEVEAKLLEYRSVRSSSGKAKMRPVIVTTCQLLGQSWPIELTLADRAKMGFRMLLGREAFRGRFLVDSGKSYYSGKPKLKKKRPNK